MWYNVIKLIEALKGAVEKISHGRNRVALICIF